MKIVFLFYEEMTALDALGPYEVLARIPSAVINIVAKRPGIIKTGLGLELMAKYSFSEISQADILVVPGGKKATSFRGDRETLTWIQNIHTMTQWTTSVCTGSLILGAAGLLVGKKATSHWVVLERLKKWGAIPQAKRIVEDGKIITAAGVSAGIDMALLLTAKLLGQETAERIQLGIEYDPQPPFNAGSPTKAKSTLVTDLRNNLLNQFDNE